MAYNATIPAANQRIKDSQQPIQDNFAAIQTLINVNHGTFGAADQGKHKWVTFPQQTVPPATGLGDVALYSVAGIQSGQPELAFRNQSSGTQAIFTEAKKQANGWTRLPSSILIAWGSISLPAGPLNFNNALLGGFGTLYSVTATSQTPSAIVSAVISGITNVTFTASINSTVYYFVVGI